MENRNVQPAQVLGTCAKSTEKESNLPAPHDIFHGMGALFSPTSFKQEALPDLGKMVHAGSSVILINLMHAHHMPTKVHDLTPLGTVGENHCPS